MALMDFYQHSRSGVSSSSSFRGTVALLCNFTCHTISLKSRRRRSASSFTALEGSTNPPSCRCRIFQVAVCTLAFSPLRGSSVVDTDVVHSRVSYALPPRRPSFLRSTTLLAGALPRTHERSPYTPSKTLMAELWPGWVKLYEQTLNECWGERWRRL